MWPLIKPGVINRSSHRMTSDPGDGGASQPIAAILSSRIMTLARVSTGGEPLRIVPPINTVSLMFRIAHRTGTEVYQQSNAPEWRSPLLVCFEHTTRPRETTLPSKERIKSTRRRVA
jgi:hypothetical protein